MLRKLNLNLIPYFTLFLIITCTFISTSLGQTSAPDQLANIVSTEIAHSYCAREFSRRHPNQRITTVNEHGTNISRIIDADQVTRHDFFMFNQVATNYMPASYVCRLNSYNTNNSDSTMTIYYPDTGITEIRKRDGDTRTKSVFANGNYLRTITLGYNSVVASVYFKGPPEEYIELHGITDFTADMVQQLQAGNKDYFRNHRYNSPRTTEPAAPRVISQ